MIAYLSGKLTEKSPDHVIVECNGVGYFVRISLNTYSRLTGGDNIKLHTYFMVKEDSQDLFGFFERDEKKILLK